MFDIRENEIEFLEKLYEAMFNSSILFDLCEQHPTALLWETIDEDVETLKDNWEEKIEGWVAIARAHDFEPYIDVVSYDDVYDDVYSDVYLVLADVRVK